MLYGPTVEPPGLWRSFAHYLVAIALVGTVTAGLMLLMPHFPMGRFPVLYAVAIAVVAYRFGAGPAVVAYLVSIPCYLDLLAYPSHSLWPPRTVTDWAGLTAYFIVTGTLLAGTLIVRRGIVDRLRAEEALRKSEQRFRSLFDCMSEGFALHGIMCDEAGVPCDYRFLEVNAAFEQQTGLKREAVLGRTIREIMPGTESSWIEAYGQVALTGKSASFEQYAAQLDRHYTVRAFSPTPGQFAVLFLDITERKRAEEDLRQTADRLSRSQAIAHLGSWELDLVNNELTWSDEVYRIFGLQPQEFGATYEAFLEAVHPDDRAAVDAAYSGSLRENKSSYEIEHRVVRKAAGEIRWVQERCYHVRDEEGKLIGSLGMVLDITERKQAETQIAEARAEAERRAAELESVIASMADGVSLTDTHGNVLLMNQAGRDVLGTPPDESFADWASRFERLNLDGEPIAPEDAVINRALRGEIVRDFVYRVVTPAGRDIVLSASATPVVDLAGRIIGGVSIFRDVSERVAFEREREDVYRREHRIAEVLQQALIPPGEYHVPGLRIAARYEPALEEAQVGGDFHDVFPLGGGKYGVLIGDVAGKGLQAAMRVAAIRHAVRSYAYLDPSPARVMALTNEAMVRHYPEGDTWMTALFAVVDPSDRTMGYTIAGHEHPVLLESKSAVREVGESDPALGFLAGAVYSEATLSLAEGDAVVLMTDGLTEARSGHSLFGKDGVLAWLQENLSAEPIEIADGLMEAARVHAGGQLRDDAIVLAFAVESECEDVVD